MPLEVSQTIAAVEISVIEAGEESPGFIGQGAPRGMIVHDRTRLIGSLQQILIKQCIMGLTLFKENLIMRAQFKAM